MNEEDKRAVRLAQIVRLAAEAIMELYPDNWNGRKFIYARAGEEKYSMELTRDKK